MTKQKILVLTDLGSAFKIGTDGELLSSPLFTDNTYDKEDWSEVTDLYPDVVREINKTFDMVNFKQNIELECYIDYLNKDNNFQKTRKGFETYDEALAWMKENFEQWNLDMISYY